MSGVSTATMLGAASLAIGAAGTISSAMGQQQQGAVAQQMAGANAAILNSRAAQVEAEAAARADIQKRNTARQIGATRAAYGASGVDVNQGTPLDVMADEATEGELQRQLILYGGKTQSLAYQQQASLALAGGAAAASAASTAAGMTLLTGAANVGLRGYNLFGGGTGGGTSRTQSMGRSQPVTF